MVASIALTLIQGAAGITLTFDLSNRDLLLTVFFTTVGLSARVSMLRAGGITLIVLTLFAMTNLVLQNVVGGGLITVLGLPPAAGLLLGSAALSGGHGTVLAWAPIIADRFVFAAAPAFGAAAATFGLIAGGNLGGPLGERLIARHRLNANDAATLSVGMPYAQASERRVNADGVLKCLLVIAIAIAASGYLNDFLVTLGVTLPAFVATVLSRGAVGRCFFRRYRQCLRAAGLHGAARQAAVVAGDGVLAAQHSMHIVRFTLAMAFPCSENAV